MGLDRRAIIKGVNTPLGFFVLALLIVESFLALVVLKASIGEYNRVCLIYLGAGLFLVETILVFYLINTGKVRDLTFDKEAHLKQDSKKKVSGNV